MSLEKKLSLSPPGQSPVAPPARRKRPWGRLAVLAVLLAAAGGGAAWWYASQPAPLPAGIVASNGRLEMDEIDIQTKFAGRVKDILADEGDQVHAGQVLARMDVADLAAQLAKARAMTAQAEQTIAQSRADLEQARTSVTLMQRELVRTRAGVPRGYATPETLDQQVQQLNSATASVSAMAARIAEAEAARDAARQDAVLVSVNIADNTLVAPKDGLLQYRLANLGEVLPAGGKLYTLLDTHYVYMDVYLPTDQAGLAQPGRAARVVLDAEPGRTLPAHVVFLADENQFTPKMVETRTERDKLMFRVRVRLDGPAAVQAGMPGVAYIRADANAPWPDVAK